MSATTHGYLTFRQPKPAPGRTVEAPWRLGSRITATLRLWRRRMRDRSALQQLSYRDMRDMGVTPADISWEVSQPFWRDAPPR